MAAPMMYLTGSANPSVRPYLDDGRIGFLQTPATSRTIGDTWIFAVDNGCYNAATYVGDDAFREWLDRFTPAERERCLFVTAPDVVGDATATLARSLPWLDVIHDLGYRAAFVAQDGLTVDTTPWDRFEWLFVGGSTEWKCSEAAYTLIRAAQARGKRVHVGRVNSGRRFAAMDYLGVDTADGTFLAFGPEKNLPRLLSWITHSETQLTLTTRERH